ncbi:MAG: CDP-alcohol phosphatidyltransferase family protein, partial [Candidatus Methylomirabilales bacterium]
LGKSTDTAIIRWVRKASIPFVKRLAETSATPNHVTLAGFLIGLGSIALFLKAEYAYVLAGALLFALSFVVDLADGMLARLKFLESRKGAWIDFVLDNVLHLGVFISLIQVVSIRSPGEHVLYLGGLLIGGSLLSALTFGRYLRILEGRKRIASSLQHPTSNIQHHLERLVEAIRHRDFSLVLLLFTLFDRVEWFLFVAAAGANVFWPMVLYLLIRMSDDGCQMSERQTPDT